MHRFRAPTEELRAGRVWLRGAELHHLRRVLRLGRGARVALFDGAGGQFLAEVSSVGPTDADLRVLGPLAADIESPLSVVLAVAIAKGTKLDWAIEKGTELGASRFMPFMSARSVPDRHDFANRVDRWRRVAAAAVAQCGRVAVPEVSDVTHFADVLGIRADRRVLFWEESGTPLARGSGESVASVLVVTGPEGGFTADEAALAAAAGFTIAGLGPRILRAETAAVAAVTLAQFLWGDLSERTHRGQ